MKTKNGQIDRIQILNILVRKIATYELISLFWINDIHPLLHPFAFPLTFASLNDVFAAKFTYLYPR